MSFVAKKQLGPIEYWIKGDHPTLLLMSGTHGDEYEVIEPLKKAVEKYSSELPDFLFIPEVSPSAVALKTRRNAAGRDTNRSFTEKTTDMEAKSTMDIVRTHMFDLCLSFHEDPEQAEFYLYDNQQLEHSMLQKLKRRISEYGISLYTGIDDPHDTTLGHMIIDGYASLPADPAKLLHGDFWEWSQHNGIVKRILFPEIPGKLPMPNKEFLIWVIFQEILFPLCPLEYRVRESDPS